MAQPPRHRTPGHAALRCGRSSSPGQIYQVTATTLHRKPFFADFDVARSTSACFERDASLGGARLLAWVLMPDHAHWLLQLGERESLARVVNRMKAGSARSANAALARRGPLWSRAYHDHGMRHDEDVRAAARYLLANPLRAGLARRIGDYPFWNASWL